MNIIDRINSRMLRITGALLVFGTILPNSLFANTDPDLMVLADGPAPTETPEIDPALATGALTLLLGVVLIMTDRLRKKTCIEN